MVVRRVAVIIRDETTGGNSGFRVYSVGVQSLNESFCFFSWANNTVKNQWKHDDVYSASQRVSDERIR